MLYNLQPSIDVTGGPWFTDSELDTEFIETLLEVCWRFIVGKTMYIKDEEADNEDINHFKQHITIIIQGEFGSTC